MCRDGCNNVTVDRGSATVVVFQVPGFRFCPAIGREPRIDATVTESLSVVTLLQASLSMAGRNRECEIFVHGRGNLEQMLQHAISVRGHIVVGVPMHGKAELRAGNLCSWSCRQASPPMAV